MDLTSSTWAVQPGSGLGSLHLGASLQTVLTLVKADDTRYTAIDVSYAQIDSLIKPVIVTLPNNGIRLRFDGQEQRLRLIEVMDFNKCTLTYKGSEINKQKENVYTSAGPAFRRIDGAFRHTFEGEYLPPAQGSYQGTYILSWPGVAFSFPLQHAAWSSEKNHVVLLSSQAASPATHMAVFEGNSWAEARKDLYTRVPTKPRSLELVARPKDHLPAEIELASLSGQGTLELVRRLPALPFTIKIGETTPEDLIIELGNPDVKHRRDVKSTAPERPLHKRAGSGNRPLHNGRKSTSLPSSYSSTATDTYDTDFDNDQAEIDPLERASRESFWCYFQHGFDILVGPPLPVEDSTNTTLHLSPHLVVLKVILHGNIPGSHAFNRHRRLRWSLAFDSSLTSETNFDSQLKPALLGRYTGKRPEADMARGKVVNRMWSGSPTDSSFFLPDADRDLIDSTGSEQWIGNTKLYHFPRLAFEVMENGAVSALTVS